MPPKPANDQPTIDEIDKLIMHSQLATGVILEAARGTRDDLKNPTQSIIDQAAYIYEALKKISRYVHPEPDSGFNYYIPGHYAGD